MTVRLTHLKYLQHDLGMGGLMNDFRSDDCHKFMHWLQTEIIRLEDNLPTGEDVGVVEVISEVINIAIFCFSKLAYKILCDTHGMIVPINLLNEVKCLEAYRDDKKPAKSRKFRGNIWDAFENKDEWIQEVISECQRTAQDIVQTLSELDESELAEIEFKPELELIIEPSTTMPPLTSHNIIVVDLVDYLKSYGLPEVRFNDLDFTETWQEYGWFEHDDWAVVLLAKVAVQVVESYRLTMKRHYRRKNDIINFDKFSSQTKSGYIEIYKMIRDHYVEPRMDLNAKLDG